MISIKFHPEPKDLRIFAGLLVPFSFLIGYLIRHYLGQETVGWWIALILCGLGILGLIIPRAIQWLFVSWMVLAFPIGWTVSHLILALIFYGMFFPIGFVARLFGYDPLQLKARQLKARQLKARQLKARQLKQPQQLSPHNVDSYWIELAKIENKEQYFRQF